MKEREKESWDNIAADNHPNGTSQAIPRQPPPGPRRIREQAAGVRRSPGGQGARKEGNGAPPEPGGITTAPLNPRGLPGARHGQELGLPQAEGRGDTQHKAGSHHKGKARRPRRLPREYALQRASGWSPRRGVGPGVPLNQTKVLRVRLTAHDGSHIISETLITMT